MLKLLHTNKKELARRLAVAECRWKNRNFKARDPKREEGIRTVEDDERERELVNRIISENHSREEGNEDFSKRFGITDFEIDAQHADMLITDSLAKSLLQKDGDVIYTGGNSRGIINVDTLSESFAVGDIIDVNRLKDKGLIDGHVAYIKVLARGRIDKPLTVYANDFSPSAVKMIALTGGKAVKVITKHLREKG
jgi:ribosomal protein L15